MLMSECQLCRNFAFGIVNLLPSSILVTWLGNLSVSILNLSYMSHFILLKFYLKKSFLPSPAPLPCLCHISPHSLSKMQNSKLGFSVAAQGDTNFKLIFIKMATCFFNDKADQHPLHKLSGEMFIQWTFSLNTHQTLHSLYTGFHLMLLHFPNKKTCYYSQRTQKMSLTMLMSCW